MEQEDVSASHKRHELIRLLLTSLIQGMKEATRVNTVGLWVALQPRPSTKLVTPCTYHLPSPPRQLRGPPESPWNTAADDQTGPTARVARLPRSFLLTWHADLLPPPAQTMVVFAELPHQSPRLQVA